MHSPVVLKFDHLLNSWQRVKKKVVELVENESTVVVLLLLYYFVFYNTRNIHGTISQRTINIYYFINKILSTRRELIFCFCSV